MFWKKKTKTEKKEYDASKVKPVLKCSICNGEQIAGFQDLKTGQFEEIAFIRGDRELKDFLDTYGLESIEKIY